MKRPKADGGAAAPAKPETRDRLRRVLFMIPYAGATPASPPESWRGAAASRSVSCSTISTSCSTSDARRLRPTTSSTCTSRAARSTWRCTRASRAPRDSRKARRPPWPRRPERWAGKASSGPCRRCATRCRASGERASTSCRAGSTPARLRPADRCWGAGSGPSPSGAPSNWSTTRPRASRSRSGPSCPSPWSAASATGTSGDTTAPRERAVAFRVDRIKECTVRDERFEARDAAELPSRLFSDPVGEPVRIRLGPSALAWARERPGVRIIQEGPKGAVVEVAGVDAGWATRFALSFAGDAEVLAPAAARATFAEAVRRALARYDG